MQQVERKRRTRNVADIIFIVLYCVEFVGALLISVLSSAVDTHETFNEPWADVLYLVLLSSLFVTAFVQNVLRSHKKWDVIVNALVFIGGLTMLLLFALVGGVCDLLMPIYSIIITVVVGCRYILQLRRDQSAKEDFKQVVAVLALLLFAMMNLMRMEFANDTIWLWALAPAAVIFVIVIIAVFALLKKVWDKIYPTAGKSVGNAIAISVMLLFFAYIYSYTVIGTANYVFDREPTPIECVVVDKHIRAGARKTTQFEIKISIDGEERWIDVRVTDYHDIEEGDTVVIDYYQGALGLPYYTFGEKAENNK